MELQNPWMLAVYVIAMIAICWHFSYGIWLFAAKWGITPGATARKRFGYVCAAFGVVCLHRSGQHLGLHRAEVPERAGRHTARGLIVDFSNSPGHNSVVILSEGRRGDRSRRNCGCVCNFWAHKKQERVPDL